jgi:hypothetical protein
MYRVIAVLGVAACSFPGHAADDGDDGDDGDDMAPVDAPVPIDGAGPADAAIDAAAPADADLDADDDGVLDAVDNCVMIGNPLQRDHDGDSRGDECDLCPHLASTTDPDGDTDGVGDACDPRVGPDVRTMWFGFYDPVEIAGWLGDVSQFSVTAGVLRRNVTTGSASAAPPAMVHDAYATTSVTITGINGFSGTRWVGVSTAAVGQTQYYACSAVYTIQGTTATYQSLWQGGGNTVQTGLGVAINTGSSFVISNWINAAGGTCEIRTPSVVTTGDPPIGPRDGVVGVYADDFSADWDYLFVVAQGD